MKRNVISVGIFAAGFVLASLFFFIPFLGGRVFLSPDETANAVSSRVFAQHGSMQIQDAILSDGPWLRPRSYVTQGTALVPVGFLGLSVFLGVLHLVFGEWGMVLATPILAISVAYPLWKITERFGKASQVLAVLTWLSFPAVTLYANRGLFPNLPVVSLAVWAAYLLWSSKKLPAVLCAGFLGGCALAIRPTEAVWVLPWLWLAWATSSEKRPSWWILMSSAAAVVPLLAIFLVSWKTYGSPFVIGYLLRDVSVASLSASTASAVPAAAPSAAQVWPFGFHPRNVWFNVRSYLFGLWGPWMILTLAAVAVWWKEKSARPFFATGVWTLAVGALMYGQAIYQDHVGVNVVSTGNSFVRYMLPLVPVFVLGIAAFLGRIRTRTSSSVAWVVPVLLGIVLVGCGVFQSFGYDDENIFADAQEVQRYVAIRDTAFSQLGANAIILSDRSDKIFFPTFRVASPMPSKENILDLVQHVTVPVAFFSTTLDARGLDQWKSDGFALVPVFTSENQTMYLIQHAT